jgi:hypothetical protein
MIRSGGHQFRLESDARGICLQDRGSSGIVPAADGAGYAAVQVASVAGKGDQVNHWICPKFYRSLTVAALPGRGSARSRLCLKYYARILSIGRHFRKSRTSMSRTLSFTGGSRLI